MKMKYHIAVALSALFLSGCGGASNSSTSGGTASPTASIKANATTINYGSPVTITWNATNAESITSNFGVSGSEFSGSVTDTPASDTTYSITASAFQNVTKSVTVHVSAGTKRILLVADQSQPNIATITQLLQSTTSVPVTVSLTLPSSFNADVLVLTSASLSPSDWPKVTSFLSSGGSVVIVGTAANLLATGDPNNNDLSSIGNVLAGVTSSQPGSIFDPSVSIVSQAQPGFFLSSTVYGVSWKAEYEVSPVSVNAIGLASDSSGNFAAFAYKPPTGGRICYLENVGIDSSASAIAEQQLLTAETRWAAG